MKRKVCFVCGAKALYRVGPRTYCKEHGIERRKAVAPWVEAKMVERGQKGGTVREDREVLKD